MRKRKFLGRPQRVTAESVGRGDVPAESQTANFDKHNKKSSESLPCLPRLPLGSLTFSHRKKFDWRFAELVTVSFLRTGRKHSGGAWPRICHIRSGFNYLDRDPATFNFLWESGRQQVRAGSHRYSSQRSTPRPPEGREPRSFLVFNSKM